MPELNKITVDPDGATLAVTITGHGSITAYTTRAGTVSVSFPDSITAPTDYWLAEVGDFTVVGTINGEEVVRETVGVADAEGAVTPTVRLSSSSLSLGALVAAAGAGGGSGALSSATLDLSSAQVLSLFSTPVTLVAAPGAGNVLVPVVAFAQIKTGTIAYVASGQLYISYAGNTNGIILPGGSGFFEADPTEITMRTADLGQTFLQPAGENKALIVGCDNANPTGGSGTLHIELLYFTATLT